MKRQDHLDAAMFARQDRLDAEMDAEARKTRLMAAGMFATTIIVSVLVAVVLR